MRHCERSTYWSPIDHYLLHLLHFMLLLQMLTCWCIIWHWCWVTHPRTSAKYYFSNKKCLWGLDSAPIQTYETGCAACNCHNVSSHSLVATVVRWERRYISRRAQNRRNRTVEEGDDSRRTRPVPHQHCSTQHFFDFFIQFSSFYSLDNV